MSRKYKYAINNYSQCVSLENSGMYPNLCIPEMSQSSCNSLRSILVILQEHVYRSQTTWVRSTCTKSPKWLRIRPQS